MKDKDRELKKPEKIKIDHSKTDFVSCNKDANYGYNNAIDDRDKWLKETELSEGEIRDIIKNNAYEYNGTCGDGREYTKYEVEPEELAKAIHKAQETKR